MWLDEIIGSSLGSFTTGELDYRPPPLLLQDLHEKTGVQPDVIRSMTLTGWVPWLFDTLDAAPDAFDTYLQGSVILAPGEARDRRVGPWRPWLPPEPLYRVCPDCLLSPGRGVTLLSQLPLMLSCPEHVKRLLPFYGVPGLPYAVTYEGPGEPVPAAVLALDALTQEGITTGVVPLPAREVHVGIWLRLLRTMIHELTAPTSRLRAGSLRSVRQVWDSIGRPNRRGSSRWRPYEQLSWQSQQEILVAVAAGLELISTNQVPARGCGRTCCSNLSWAMTTRPVNLAPTRAAADQPQPPTWMTDRAGHTSGSCSRRPWPWPSSTGRRPGSCTARRLSGFPTCMTARAPHCSTWASPRVSFQTSPAVGERSSVTNDHL